MGSDSPPGYFETPHFYVQISVDEPAEAERIFHAGRKAGEDADRANLLVCPLWHVGRSVWHAVDGELRADHLTSWEMPVSVSLNLKPQRFSLMLHTMISRGNYKYQNFRQSASQNLKQSIEFFTQLGFQFMYGRVSGFRWSHLGIGVHGAQAAADAVRYERRRY